MLKKIVVLTALFMLVGFSFSLLLKESESGTARRKEQNESVVASENILYSFSKDKLLAQCSVQDIDACAVETAVKCTINPDLDGCRDANLPKFIFMKDPSLERPSEISYRITSKRVLVNNSIEVHTKSSCNGGWFGLCQGTVIYVLSENEKGRFVKDIYAIEL